MPGERETVLTLYFAMSGLQSVSEADAGPRAPIACHVVRFVVHDRLEGS
jgi:hypothetical protein